MNNSLTRVNIGSGVTHIGDNAFMDCRSLSSFTIPANVTSVGSNILSGTPWMNRQANGLVYLNNWLLTYKGDMPRNTNITVRNGTVGIADGVFYEQANLRSITIPNSVVMGIGGSTFNYCTSLQSVIFGNGVPSIENNTFFGCRALTHVTFGTGLKHIGERAFSFRHCRS
jgi:hypothetical protein